MAFGHGWPMGGPVWLGWPDGLVVAHVLEPGYLAVHHIYLACLENGMKLRVRSCLLGKCIEHD